MTDGRNIRGRGGNQALEQALRQRGGLNKLPESGDNEGGFRRNWNRSGGERNLSDSDDARRSFQDQVRRANRGTDGDSGKYRDFARRGKWSKDRDEFSPITRRWFGQSGFGDHRDRSDRHRGDRDDDFAKHVRKNWHNQWQKHWRDDDGDHRHHRRHLPFAFSWWAGYDRSPYHVYWRDDRWRRDPYYWWQPCTAPLLTTWITYDWYEPCYWDYGYGEFVDYRNNYVYVDGQLYGSALDYYAQVRGLAQSVPALSPEQWAAINWLPLGVFAVTRPGTATSQEIVQLAVSPDGILSGTLYNQQTGTARPLKGMVDQATQRAAWVLADAPGDALVVETSLFNLTEPECTALAHLGPVSTEVWRLVRLEQPAEAALAPPAQ